MRAFGQQFRLVFHPLGPDRHQGLLALAGHVQRGCVNQLARGQPHQGAPAGNVFDRAGQLVVLADEAGDEAVLGTFVQVRRRGKLLDAPVIEHRNAVAHRQRLALIMGDIDHGDAQRFVQVLDLELHVLAQLLVQRAQRLVHQHQRRVEHQRARQGDALLLAARQLCGTAADEGPHLHHVQRAGDLRLALGLGHAAHFQRKGQVLADRHMRKQGIILENHADSALVRRHLVDRAARQPDFAVRRRLEAGQHHQAGGLARSGRPQHRQEFTLGDGQVQLFHDQSFAIIAFLDAVEFDKGI